MAGASARPIYGAFSQMARVKGDWIIPLPPEFTTAEAMAIGTAGYTAMLAILALEKHGVELRQRPGDRHRRRRRRRLDGGRAALAGSATRSIAVTGQADERDYLMSLGAGEIIDRAELERRAEAPRQGALGRRHRRGRRHGARQRPVDDHVRRRGGGLRQCRRLGARHLGRALHPARCVAPRHQFDPIRRRSEADRGLDPARPRHRPRQARRR